VVLYNPANHGNMFSMTREFWNIIVPSTQQME
jgi:hypothetical protein